MDLFARNQTRCWRSLLAMPAAQNADTAAISPPRSASIAASSPPDSIATKNSHPNGWLFLLVRQMGLEPIRSRTRPSNVPVCQFQHCRAPCHYSRRRVYCQFLFDKILSSFYLVLIHPNLPKIAAVLSNLVNLLQFHTVSFGNIPLLLFSGVFSRYNTRNA